MNIIQHKNWYFLFSLVVIIPGIISFLLWGLNLSIDFTGGTRVTFDIGKVVSNTDIKNIQQAYTGEKIAIVTLQNAGKTIIVRTAPVNESHDTHMLNYLKTVEPNIKQVDFETIGPVIGKEITTNAFKSIVLASILIVLYIAYSFRKVPKPTSSWRFGICAILALLHDVLVVVGIFSILGHFLKVEVDTLFVTALLTVIGFSVHDTIVVFDRIRENLLRVSGYPFDVMVNNSILQTIGRSLNTSLTAILVLLTLLFFGGDSVRWFIVALLIGIASGTYSSIFNAAPLLVLWNEWDLKRKLKS